ncbi:hypothetical protein ACA910_019384 [Epithemia clementina (nom. ined.)]
MTTAITTTTKGSHFAHAFIPKPFAFKHYPDLALYVVGVPRTTATIHSSSSPLWQWQQSQQPSLSWSKKTPFLAVSTSRSSAQRRRAISFCNSRLYAASASSVPPWNSTTEPPRMENVPRTDSSPTEETYSDIPYNWKTQWYALTFSSYVPNPSQSAEVTPAAVFGQPLVLWREVDNGPIYCADDVCPHRATALSEGRVRNGTLTCYYHGWQFSGQQNGACQAIPQLAPGARLPQASSKNRACLRMRPCQESEGMVWVWMGDPQEGDAVPTKDPPSTGVLGPDGKRDGYLVYDFMIDLPYDASYLVENLLDPAHIAISHDRTSGGGRRERAEGYEMKVDETSFSSNGFTGFFRPFSRQATNAPSTKFVFEAPGIVRNIYDSTDDDVPNSPLTEERGDQTNKKKTKKKKQSGIFFGAALHCMPLGWRRSRLFFRVYNKGLPWLANLILSMKPLWLRHLNSCKVLEQDVGLITTQEDHFHRHAHRQPSQDYFMVQSSDTYVKSYRQWMDRVGHGMPWFQGLARSSPTMHAGDSAVWVPTNNNKNGGGSSSSIPTAALPPALTPAYHRASNQDVVETRYHRHVLHCPTTRTALRTIQRWKWTLAAVSGTSWTALSWMFVSLLIRSSLAAAPAVTAAASSCAWMRVALRVSAIAGPVSFMGFVALHFLERRFFVSFKRKDQLQSESGLPP